MKETQKVGFFKRLKIAIFDIDKYDIFIEENLGTAIKFLALYVFIFILIVSGVLTYRFNKQVDKGYSYLKNEFPDFYFQGTDLHVNDVVEAYDEEYKVRFIVNTKEDITEQDIYSYLSKARDSETTLIFLKDKLIAKVYTNKNEFEYKELNQKLDFEDLNKKECIKLYESFNKDNSIAIVYYISMVMSLVIQDFLELVLNVLIISIIGLIVARFCGIIMKTSVANSLAIYSITLSNICSFIYTIINNCTGFEIKYFQAMYMMIAYVYIIAVIFIIKSDLMKQSQDLMRIKSVEEQIKEELERQKKLEEENKQQEDENDKEKEKSEEEKEIKKDKNNQEPKGSEV